MNKSIFTNQSSSHNTSSSHYAAISPNNTANPVHTNDSISPTLTFNPNNTVITVTPNNTLNPNVSSNSNLLLSTPDSEQDDSEEPAMDPNALDQVLLHGVMMWIMWTVFSFLMISMNRYLRGRLWKYR